MHLPVGILQMAPFGFVLDRLHLSKECPDQPAHPHIRYSYIEN